MEIVSKISAGTVFGGPKEIRKALGDLPKIPLMQVFGEAQELESGQSPFKDEATGEKQVWTALLGQFKARNVVTKKEYFAGKCFLPGVMQALIIAQVKAMPGQRVQFACEIGVRANENIAVGYEYYASSLIPQDRAHDPFAAIENKAAAYAAGLPAPEEHDPLEQAIAESMRREGKDPAVNDPSKINLD